MELQGERVIDASRATVWQALNDPEVLKACIPGCEELEKTSDDTFEGQIVQKVGPVKARFKGAVTLSDVVEGESYRIDGEGKGGAAGFAKGGADVTLTDSHDGGTLLAFDASAKVGGKLAQLGNRLVDGFAKKMADQFFDRFKEEVEGPGDEPEATPAVDEAPEVLVAAEAAPAVAIDQAQETEAGHPADAPGAAGPTTRDEPISGAATSEQPVATQAGEGPAGGSEGAYQATMAKASADMAARQDDPAAEDPGIEADPARGPAEQPSGRAAPETPRKAAPKADTEPEKKKGWFARLFGL